MIKVEPLTLPWIEALVEGPATFTERFGIEVVDGWLAFPDALPHMLKAARGGHVDLWGSHLFFEDEALVGFGGWKGAPIDGRVELGYAVAPERQGKGIATTVVKLLVARASDAGVAIVLAHTLAASSPSTTVLENNGFKMVESVEDPDDGTLWRWELMVGASGHRIV